MPASPIFKHLYHEHVAHFGEPTGTVVFSDPPPPDDTWPQDLLVLWWADSHDLDITSFATIGMADKPMNGCDFRAELHFSVRGSAKVLPISQICAFVANIAMYPYMCDTFLDWRHLIASPGDIPSFPSCQALFIHPAFRREGWQTSSLDGLEIRILNLVPITPGEAELCKAKGRDALMQHFRNEKIDLFFNRLSVPLL